MQAKPEARTVAAMLLTEIAPTPTPTPVPAPVPVRAPTPEPPKVERVTEVSPLPLVKPEQTVASKQKPVAPPTVAKTQPKITASKPATTAADTVPSKTPVAPDASTTVATTTASAMIEPGVRCPQPAYPKMSRRQLEEGLVTLRFLVGEDGQVLQTEIAGSSGFSRLDDAARQALSKCQFRPAMQSGRATQSWTAIKYLWRLE